MKYFCEFSLLSFPAWSGGKDTKESIIAVGRVDDFNDLIGNAITQSRKFANSATKMAQSAVAFNAFTTATEHLQNLLGGLIEDFNAFDKSMRAVNTMAGENKI